MNNFNDYDPDTKSLDITFFFLAMFIGIVIGLGIAYLMIN